MRKLGTKIYDLQHESPLNCAHFDNFGNYLLTSAGEGLSVFDAKHWDQAPIYSNQKVHDNGVVSIARFSNSAKMIVSGGTEDRFMKVYGISK